MTLTGLSSDSLLLPISPQPSTTLSEAIFVTTTRHVIRSSRLTSIVFMSPKCRQQDCLREQLTLKLIQSNGNAIH